jgi:HAD superfamily hydrolase (TIGR01549 family)
MIKAIFFDFDGTVSDAKNISYLSMVRALKDFGYEFNEKKLLKLMGSKMPVILKELGLKVDEVEAVRKKFYKYFTEAAVAGGIKPCVSLKPLWKLSKNYPLIVISNSEGSFLRASIKKLKIEGLFKKVYGADKFKTKDELLKKLFREMEIKASEAIYVGDRFSDVDYARKAGCVAIAIHNKCSWSTLAEIKKEKPDFIIRDFRGLGKILKLKS